MQDARDDLLDVRRVHVESDSKLLDRDAEKREQSRDAELLEVENAVRLIGLGTEDAELILEAVVRCDVRRDGHLEHLLVGDVGVRDEELLVLLLRCEDKLL